MSKKALLSIALVGLLAFGIGMGSFAWFTSSATSTNNTFTAGTLEVNGSSPFDITESDSAVLGKLQPGDQENFTFNVDNTGSLDMQYRYKLDGIDGGLAKLDADKNANNPVQISFDNGSTWVNINDNTFYEPSDNVIASNDTPDECTVLIRLPKDAGNFYQGKNLNFKVVIQARQNNNNASWTQE